ncbi:MAG: L-threonylcarbamoyladenylate synthase, partial [Actinomycetota bacterium]
HEGGLHLGEAEWIHDLVRELPPAAQQVIDAFWPGPLTLVLPKSNRVPDLVTAGRDSVAVRMPAHPVALELIRRVGEPVAAPSANLFSRPSPTTAAHVLEDLNGRIDAVLDGGATDVGVESTVLDLRDGEPRILRPGGVTREELARVLGHNLDVTSAATADHVAAAAPGQLTRHYSPRAEVRLYDGPTAAVLAAMKADAMQLGNPRTTAILAYTEDAPAFQGAAGEVVDLGGSARPEEAARTLYALMRSLDERGFTHLIVRLAPAGGLGDAVNDRLRRAASGRVFRVD